HPAFEVVVEDRAEEIALLDLFENAVLLEVAENLLREVAVLPEQVPILPEELGHVVGPATREGGQHEVVILALPDLPIFDEQHVSPPLSADEPVNAVRGERQIVVRGSLRQQHAVDEDAVIGEHEDLSAIVEPLSLSKAEVARRGAKELSLAGERSLNAKFPRS